MRLTFQARQTRFHSPVTLRNPRSENCLNPITDLMMPKTGSTVCLAKRVGGLARLGFQSVCHRLHRRSICLQVRRLCKPLAPVRMVVLTGLCNQRFYAGLAAGIEVFGRKPGRISFWSFSQREVVPDRQRRMIGKLLALVDRRLFR
jgi:hypothetical protein